MNFDTDIGVYINQNLKLTYKFIYVVIKARN